MKVYIITHKDYHFPVKSSIYAPLLVGANKNKTVENFEKDNDFEGNISDKNPYYCELTGIYKVWKTSSEDIVGICHYRRYFTTNRNVFPESHILNEKTIRSVLHDYDLILPQRGMNEYNGLNAKDFFIESHKTPEVWDNLTSIIKSDYPDYLDSFRWFEKQEIGYCFNMMICSKSLFDEYCGWLFPILEKLEQSLDLDSYEGYNQRMIGFVSERLINVWVHYKNLHVKEYPIYSPENPPLKRIQRKITKTLRR